MIEIAYYHNHGYRTLFKNRGDLLGYLGRTFPGAARFSVSPSQRRVIPVRQERFCTEHPKVPAVGFYTTCDADYKPTGEVYLCRTCTERRGDAWLELGELEKIFTRSAEIYASYPEGDLHFIARVVQGEDHLMRPRLREILRVRA